MGQYRRRSWSILQQIILEDIFFLPGCWYIVRMDQQRRVGLILILIGICIPLMTLPFLSGYSRDKGFFDNFYRVGIELRKDKPADAYSHPLGDLERQDRKGLDFSRLIPKRIPFRFFLAPSLILFYLGFVKIDASRRKEDNQREGEE